MPDRRSRPLAHGRSARLAPLKGRDADPRLAALAHGLLLADAARPAPRPPACPVMTADLERRIREVRRELARIEWQADLLNLSPDEQARIAMTEDALIAAERRLD